MSSDKAKFSISGLIAKIVEPHASIKGANSRQQSHITALVSLVLGPAFFVAALILVLANGQSGLIFSMFMLSALMAAACALGRSENYQTGSVILVSTMILSGILISAAIPDYVANIMILMVTMVPAFAFSILLLPVLAIIIISVVTIIAIGILPMVGVVNVTSGLILFVGTGIIAAVFALIARFRDVTENQQLEEIGSLRGRLEERVEERTRFTRIAAEIAREIISSASLDDVFSQTVNLITARFGFSYTGVYMADDAGVFLVLKAAQGQDAEKTMRAGKRIAFGPPSLLGWVAENKQQRVITRTIEDSLQLQAEFQSESQSEMGIPIMSGDKVLGILDVQSPRSTVFDNETIVVLQMLANQIATGIENIRQFEVGQGSAQEIAQVYLSGYKIIQSKTENDVLQHIRELFAKTAYIGMFLTPQGNELEAVAKTNTIFADGQTLPETISVAMEEVEPLLANEAFIGEGARLNSLPYNLVRVVRQCQIFSLALIPISYAGKISAILLLGTQERNPLEVENIQVYINLGNQIGTSLNNITEARSSEKRLAEMEALTRLSSEASRAGSDIQVVDAVEKLIRNSTNSLIFLQAENNEMKVLASVNIGSDGEPVELPASISVPPAEIYSQLGDKVVVEEVSKLTALFYAQFHPELHKFIEGEATQLPILNSQLVKLIEVSQFKNVALIPITRNEQLLDLLLIGSKGEQGLYSSEETLGDLKKLLTEAFIRVRNEQELEHRLSEDEMIILMGQEITLIRELPTLYRTLHTHIRQTMGDVNFQVAILEANTNSISIPYMYEKGDNDNETITKMESFPIGEGLTSIPIRTKQPLLLVEDAEKRALALGAKITGAAPKSWLGTPLIVADEVVGAIVLQDIEREFAFDENDLRFLSSLSVQVAGTIYNTRLLEETRNRAIQLQTAAEIARDISGLLDLGDLLNKAVTLICERFNYYHASIFLVDAMNEFAQIREATGEAGTQMKRAGHKLKVGSKSIVGFVTGNGEPLIVNDTSRDATYFANPLLPETRAEVAIPLKVGQRILGALDVQSTQAFSFAQEDISVLRILADQMAIAVINSELFADTQEHLSQSRLLHHVTTAAASGTTLEEALTGAVQSLQVTLGGDRVSILLADKDKKTLSINSYVGYSEEIGQLKVPFGEGITGWVAVHQQPQRINDVSQDARYIQAGSNVHSELAVPLLYRGELLGVLNVESDQVGAYNENDEEMLGTLGGCLSAIIANARLIEQVRRQVDRERLLYDVTSKIRRSTDMQTIMTSTATELSKALGARRTQIKIGTFKGEPVAPKPEQQPDSPAGDSQ